MAAMIIVMVVLLAMGGHHGLWPSHDSTQARAEAPHMQMHEPPPDEPR